MPAILTISCYHFLLRSDSKAAAVLSALGEAVQVNYDWDGHKKVWFPDEREHDVHIGMEVIRADQCRDLKPVPTARRLKAPSE